MLNGATGRYELLLPPGALVEAGGIWTVTGLEAVPATNSSRDVDFSLQVETLDGGQSAATVLPGGRITVQAQADAPSLSAAPPAASEGDSVPLNLSAVLGDLDGSETFSPLRLKDVPSGWTVRQNGTVLPPDANGYTLNAALLGTVTVTPPADFGADTATLLHLEAVVKDTDPDTGASNSRTVTLEVPVTVLPVADVPNLVVRDARGLEDSGIALDIRATETDADGSETLTLTIDNVPAGATFRQGGVTVGTDMGGGRWSFDAAVTAALAGNALTIVPPPGSNADFTLTVNLQSQDGTSTATTSRDLAVDVRGVADAPLGLPTGGFSFSGIEDQALALDLSALTPSDTDDSERLSVVLSGLPAGFQVTVPAGFEDALIYAGPNRWIVAQSALGVLSLVPPANFSGSRSFSADIIVTESDGAVRVDHRAVSVAVDDRADAAIISLNAAGTEDAGTAFALSIAVSDGASATDPSGETVTSVIIDGLPAWASLTHPTIANLLLPQGNGSYQVNPAYLGNLALLQQLQVVLPTDFSGTAPGIGIHVTTRDSNGDSRVTDMIGAIQAAAVSDIAVSHDANGAEIAYTLADVHGGSASGIVLPITAHSSDDDGSETLSYEIGGVPEGVLLSHGSNLGGGIWHLTAAQYAQALAAGGLAASIPNATAWGLDPAAGFALSVRAVTHEANGSLNGNAVASLKVTWEAGAESVQHVADGRTIATEFSGNEDRWIPLDLGLSGADQDGGDETVDVVVTSLPAGARLNHGNYDVSTGSWVLSPADLADLAVLPPHNFSGDMSVGVRVVVTEAGGDVRSDDFTVTVHLAPVSDAAVVSANAHGLEDQPVALNLSVTPSDSTGTPEAITGIRVHGVPTGATLSAGTRNADGTWSLNPSQLPGLSLTPPAQWSGTISLAVEVTSQDGAAAPLTVTRPVTVVVTPVADAATLTQGQPAIGDEDTTIALNLSLTRIDTDGSEVASVMISGLPDGSVLSAGIRDNQGNWVLTPGQLAGLTVRPPADWSGTLDLTATATTLERGNDAVSSVSLPVSVLVKPVADKPVADPVDVTTDEDVPVALSLNLAVSDSSESVGARISGVPLGASFTRDGQPVGTLAATANDTATWIIGAADIAGLILVPPPNAKGTWTFGVTPVSADGASTRDGETSPLVLHVKPVSDAPTLSVTGASGNEDTRIPLDIRAALTDASETLSAIISDIPAGASLWWNGTRITVTNGTATLNAPQLSGLSLSIQPRTNSDVDFVLRVQAFSQDGTAAPAHSQEVLLPVTVAPVSDLPNISATALSGNEDTRINLPTATLADTDGSETLTEVKISGIPDGAILRSGETVITVANGTAILAAGQRANLTLQTKQDYSGTFNITYSATSQDGTAAPATRTRVIPVTVNPVSDLPTLAVQPAEGLEDTRIALTISAATTDVDGSETLSLTLSGIPAGSVLRSGETVIAVTNGTATLSSAQLTGLTLQPPLNHETDFTLTVTAISKDGAATPASITMQLPVNVIPVEDAPVLSIPLADQTATEDMAFQYALPAGSFTDPDMGDVLTHQATLPDGSPLPSWLHFDTATGIFSGQPGNDDVGSFAVRIIATDRAGLSTADTFVLTVDNVNDAPVAVNDSFTGFEGEIREIASTDLLANDYDIDKGDTIHMVRVFGASHGSVVLDPATGKVVFTPEAGFVGNATFQYEIADKAGAVSVATATITLLPRPEIQAGALRVPVDGAAAWQVDADANGYGPLSFALGQGPAHGVVKLAADGTYQYFANAGYQGTDSFQVIVTNALGGSNAARVNVGIGVDIAATGYDDSFEGKAGDDVFTGGAGDDRLTGNKGNDTLTGGDGNDTLVGGSGDNILDGGAGTDTAIFDGQLSDYVFERVTLSDGTQAVKVTSRATATVTIDVGAVNDPPVARDDTALAREDSTLTIGCATLLANDTDVDGDLLSIVGNGDAAHGTVTAVRAPDGTIISFSYKPAANFHGEDSFTYTISDGHGGLSTATVKLIMQEVEDAPVAVNDSVILLEDTTQAISAASLLANDTDVDGDPLSIVGNTNAAHGTVTAVRDAAGNIAQFNYTPYGNYFGADSFTYTISDGRGGVSTATVQLNVTNVNDAPVVNGEYVSYVWRYGALGLSFSYLLSNDSDPDRDPLTIINFITPGGSYSTSNGVLYYWAYSEGVSYVYYDVSDGHGGVTRGTLTVNAYHTPFVVDLDGNGATLINLADSTAYFDVNGDGFREKTTWAGPNDAILAYDRNGDGVISESDEVVLSDLVTNPNATGTFLGLPSLDSNGDGVLDSRDAEWGKLGLWRDADQDGVNDEGEFKSLDAMGIAKIPLAAETVTETRNGTIITAKGSVVFTDGTTAELVDAEFAYEPNGIRTNANGNIAIGISENAGASLSSRALVPSGSGLTVVGVDTALHGTVVLENGTVNFVPEADFSGLGTFVVHYSDGSSRVVTVEVASVTAPVAVADAVQGVEDTLLVISAATLLANDHDAESDTLTITGFTQPTHAAITAIRDSKGIITGFEVRPTADFNGPDAFTYTIGDGHGGFSTQSVVVSFAAVNDGPVAHGDDVLTVEDHAVTIDAATLMSNDSDVEHDALTITAVTNALGGTVSLNAATGMVTFTPSANFHGRASFDYLVSDGHGGTNTGTVTVVVAEANDTPRAVNDSASTIEDKPVVIDVLANDTDPDGDPVTVLAVYNVTGGTVSVNSNGTCTFTPDANSTASGSFQYAISDGTSILTGIETIKVGNQIIDLTANNAPFGKNDAVSTGPRAPVVITVASLLGNDWDFEGDTMTIETVDSVTNGTAVYDRAAGIITFTPTGTGTGAMSFEYVVSDGHGGIARQTVQIAQGTAQATIIGTDTQLSVSQTATGYDRAAVTGAGSVALDLAPANIRVAEGGSGNDHLWSSGNSAVTLSGGGGNDTLTGGSGNDTLDGGTGNDTLFGGAGADTIRFGLGSGQDLVLAGTGSSADTIVLGAGLTLAHVSFQQVGNDLVLRVLRSDDRMTLQNWFVTSDRITSIRLADGTSVPINLATIGTSAAEIITGTADNDTLIGLSGNDTLNGGVGDDIYIFSRGDSQDTIADNAGNGDVLQFGVGITGADLQACLVGSDLVVGVAPAGGTTQAFDQWTDKITLKAWTTLASRVETFRFADGTTLYASGIASLLHTQGADMVTWTETALVLDGLGGNDVITGSAYADTLAGGQGNDTLIGGGGDDTYIFNRGDGQDTVIDSAGSGDALQFGVGITATDVQVRLVGSDLVVGVAPIGDTTLAFDQWTDKITLKTWTALSSRVEVFRFADGTVLNVGAIVGLQHTQGADTVTWTETALAMDGLGGNDIITGGAYADTISGGDGNDTLVGGAGADTLLGGEGNDVLYGNTGNDTLDGGAGADYLMGNAGADTLIGGAGVDFAGYHNASSGVVADLMTGGSGGDASGDVFIGIENLNGSAYGDTLRGDDGVNEIRGNAGNDTLLGRGGDDQLYGGSGADVLDGGDGFDYVRYDDSQSGVTVNLATGRCFGGEAEGDRISGVEAVYGSRYGDVLVGDSGRNDLYGSDGNDTLSGGAGDDQLYGGSGADVLDGGDGFDYVRYDDSLSGVTVNLATGQGFGGTAEGDRISGVEAVYGSRYGDVLVGDSGRNDLYGSDGNDTLSGGAGDDMLTGGMGADVLNGGDGFDHVRYDDSQSGVTVNLATGQGFGGEAEGDRISGVELVYGSRYADVLVGDAGSNHLHGQDGNDTLLGGAGDDLFWGGLGADVIDGGDGFDQARYDSSPSGVTVNLATGQGFGGDAEGDSISGVECVVGSLYGDVLVGDAGTNHMNGLDGNDTLSGGGGDDLLWGGLGADVIDGGDGLDQAHYEFSQSGVTVDLATGQGFGGEAQGDRISGVEAVFGSLYGDVLVGDAGSNYLYGLDGNDTLSGGAGDDVFWGGLGADVIDGGDGLDYVRYDDSLSGVTVNLATGQGFGGTAEGDRISGVEFAVGSQYGDVLVGDAADNQLFGLVGNDILDGGGGNDSLNGGAGADTLMGGAGNDTLAGGTGNDLLVGGAGTDFYKFNVGNNSDVLDNHGEGASGDSVLMGVSRDRVWFAHSGNDLLVSLTGTSDTLTILDWYVSEANRVSRFLLSDGATLLAADVENLVSAMAMFAPPMAGQTQLTVQQQEQLVPVLAANWRS